jgi:NTE family protein
MRVPVCVGDTEFHRDSWQSSAACCGDHRGRAVVQWQMVPTVPSAKLDVRRPDVKLATPTDLPHDKDLGRGDVTRPRVGLVCSGGGAKGLLQLGFLDQLARAGLGPDAFDHLCGVSAGALALYAFASRCELSDIIDLATDRLANRWLRWLPCGHLLHLWRLLRGRLLADMRQHLPCLPLETISPRLSIVSFDILHGKPFVHTVGDPITAIAASTAVPLIGKPLPYGSRLLIDGGAWCNLPVQPIRELVDVIIAVDLSSSPDAASCRYGETLPGMALRMWGTHRARNLATERSLCDLLITPDLSTFSFCDLSPVTIDRLIRLGRDVADEALPRIRSLINDRLPRVKRRSVVGQIGPVSGFGQRFRLPHPAGRRCDSADCARRCYSSFSGETSCTTCH